MNKIQAVDIIWEYMHMNHQLKAADCIFILGSNDPNTARHASSLFHAGYAPVVAISGDGTKHENATKRAGNSGRPEAEVLKEICIEAGVPESAILTESEANNTEQNFKYIRTVLQKAGVKIRTVIAVQKPYMERRTYATGKMFWPDIELILSSQSGTFDDYVAEGHDKDTIISKMLGDLERIKEYPALGFQIPQEIPGPVWEAFLFLKDLGYTKYLLQK